MKNLCLIIVLVTQLSFAQADYFNGDYTFCPLPDDKESKDNYKLGLDCVKANLYIGGANRLFLDLIKKDSTFCDAYYWAGYTYRLSKMNKAALTYYYVADSLSNNKSLLFKQNLAFMASIEGSFTLTRKKYDEIKQYFPKSPEGYYGIASTSLIIGDSENGLENLNLAMMAYNQMGRELGEELYWVQGIILTRVEKYDESILVFEKLSGSITKNDEYNFHYALSLMKEGKLNNNEKQIKKAKKLYEKVKDKSNLTEMVTSEFQ